MLGTFYMIIDYSSFLSEFCLLLNYLTATIMWNAHILRYMLLDIHCKCILSLSLLEIFWIKNIILMNINTFFFLLLCLYLVKNIS